MPELSGRDKEAWDAYWAEIARLDWQFVRDTDPLYVEWRDVLGQEGPIERSESAYRRISEARQREYAGQLAAGGKLLQYQRSKKRP